jgi:peptide methionine sulfoxide reductase msrA/msrB
MDFFRKKTNQSLNNTSSSEQYWTTENRRQLNAVIEGISIEASPIQPTNNVLKVIYFAGGCFWGTQGYVDRIYGVIRSSVGYVNGNTENPSYEDVCHRNSGHAEAVEVWYHPERIRLETLIDAFFKTIDPTTLNRQGNDVGTQYRSGIYYTDLEQLPAIQEVLMTQNQRFNGNVVTEVLPLAHYYSAEKYHQKYLDNHPNGYCHVNLNTAPEPETTAHNVALLVEDLKAAGLAPKMPQLIEQLTTRSYSDGLTQDPLLSESFEDENKSYSKPTEAEILKKLTPLQYEITQKEGTERAFDNAYWDEKRPGIYVDIVTGEPLFLSTHKFDSGTGWPSFTQPIESEQVTLHSDRKIFMRRTEVRSKVGQCHLGHVFDDGPSKAGGKRFCINSASLEFIPLELMTQRGYASFIDKII